MKKYLFLGIIMVLLVAVILPLSWIQGVKASSGKDSIPLDPIAFYGTAKAGKTVCASGSEGTYCTTAGGNNWYLLRIPSYAVGMYFICDGCQSANRFWDGYNGQRVDFCVSIPGHVDCPCF